MMAKTEPNEWVDVSIPLKTGMVHWPDDPPVKIENVLDLDQGDPCSVSKISMSVHTGTHIDAPRHYIRDGHGIDEMPFEATVGVARVIEIHDGESIKKEALIPHHIRQGERILFKSQNSSRCWKSNRFEQDYIYLTKGAARFLADLKVKTIGVDYLSVGGLDQEGTETHLILLNAGIWIIEGLDLSKIEEGKYQLICLPIKMEKGDGAPARAIVKKASCL